jgi:hypothetical protein
MPATIKKTNKTTTYGVILTLQAQSEAAGDVGNGAIAKRKSRAKTLLENPHLNP